MKKNKKILITCIIVICVIIIALIVYFANKNNNDNTNTNINMTTYTNQSSNNSADPTDIISVNSSAIEGIDSTATNATLNVPTGGYSVDANVTITANTVETPTE